MSQFASAQVTFSNGEFLLRGTLVKSKKNQHLIVNPKSRAMRVFDLRGIEVDTSKYISGVNVEVCVNITEQGQDSNTPALLNKIRPLAPNEAIIYYTGNLTGCPKSNGCSKFGRFIEAPIFGGGIQLSDLKPGYLQCENLREPNSANKQMVGSKKK